MMLATRTIWMLALLVSLPALATTGWVYRGAIAAELAAAKRRERVTSHAEELQQLRTTLPAWAHGVPARAEASASLAQRVPAAIAAAGLPATALSSLSPESNSGASEGLNKTGVRIDRRRATLTFGALTLPQLGRFLAAWREREPHWVVTSIDATPERSSLDRGGNGGQVQPGGDLPVRVVLAVESLSVQRPKTAADPVTRPSSASLLPVNDRRSGAAAPRGHKPAAPSPSSTVPPSAPTPTSAPTPPPAAPAPRGGSR